MERLFSPHLRMMSEVKRWQILRRIREQSIADHSYYVAVYAWQIAKAIEWTGDKEALMVWALFHDVRETVTGDIPGPVKRGAKFSDDTDQINRVLYLRGVVDHSKHQDLNQSGLLILKLANLVDEMMYLGVERSLGNALPARTVENCIERVEQTMSRLAEMWAEGTTEFNKGWHDTLRDMQHEIVNIPMRFELDSIQMPIPVG